ncbi:MAG TPA: methyltransferase domain-containing protein [Gemmatimonadales bacterium]|nr:methyltransferase domain-containing protein [Gemmatimonadales bacterium]
MLEYTPGALAAAVTLILVACAGRPEPSPSTARTGSTAPDVPFVASPMEVVETMLRLARLTGRDVIYDLGSGDGRIVIEAARRVGARGVGVELDPALVELSRRRADSAGVGDRVAFRRADIFETDLRPATVVTLFLGDRLNRRLRPKLFRELRPGTRVVSNHFDMGEWRPDSVATARGRGVSATSVYLWVIPAHLAGVWRLRLERGAPSMPGTLELALGQRYRRVTGTASAPGRRLELRGVQLAGAAVALTLADLTRPDAPITLRLAGTASADAMHGTFRLEPTGAAGTWHAHRERRGLAPPWDDADEPAPP